MARINMTFGFVVVATVLLLACTSARPIEIEAGPKEPACVSKMKKAAKPVCEQNGPLHMMTCKEFCEAIQDFGTCARDCGKADVCNPNPKNPLLPEPAKECKNCEQTATRMSKWYCNVLAGVEEEGQEVAP